MTRRPADAPGRARRRASVARLVAGSATWAAAACARGPDAAAVQGAALRHLFRERERGRALAVWADVEPGPVLAAAGVRGAPVDGRAAATIARITGLPVTRVTGDDMTRLFRAHGDGWAAFYRRHPGAPGLVEVGAVERRAGGGAAVLVGRSCGEHCRHLWRVELPPAGAARGVAPRVAPVAVPE